MKNLFASALCLLMSAAYAGDVSDLTGAWVGSGINMNLDDPYHRLGTSTFVCQVNSKGQFGCDAISANKPYRECIKKTVPFHGQIFEIAHPLYYIQYFQYWEESAPSLTAYTPVLVDGDRVTILTVANSAVNLDGFFEYTVLQRVDDLGAVVQGLRDLVVGTPLDCSALGDLP